MERSCRSQLRKQQSLDQAQDTWTIDRWNSRKESWNVPMEFLVPQSTWNVFFRSLWFIHLSLVADSVVVVVVQSFLPSSSSVRLHQSMSYNKWFFLMFTYSHFSNWLIDWLSGLTIMRWECIEMDFYNHSPYLYIWRRATAGGALVYLLL